MNPNTRNTIWEMMFAKLISIVGAVTRTELGRWQFGSLSVGSRRGGGSPRLERFVSEDAECVAGDEMALDAYHMLADNLPYRDLGEAYLDQIGEPVCRSLAASCVRVVASALREQILDVAIAERETDIEPNGMPDDRRRELVAVK
jgi:hypothetical protein